MTPMAFSALLEDPNAEVHRTGAALYKLPGADHPNEVWGTQTDFPFHSNPSFLFSGFSKENAE